jgi:hypothetical protein
VQADREAILHLLGIDTSHGPISLNQSGILGSLASPIFLANGSIIASDATGDADGHAHDEIDYALMLR